MQIIGLTGSIASGKSSVANMFKRLLIPVHDADKVAHELMAPNGIAVPQILQQFGDVGSLSGGIDRHKLGTIIFQDGTAKNQLEMILHPLIFENRSRFLRLMQSQRYAKVVLDVPLLFETGSQVICDTVICVWAPKFLQYQRALRRAGMTPEKLDAIINYQMPQHDKKTLADFTLPTGLGKADTFRRLRHWLKQN